jgi:hypothetical protein
MLAQHTTSIWLISIQIFKKQLKKETFLQPYFFAKLRFPTKLHGTKQLLLKKHKDTKIKFTYQVTCRLKE